MDKSVTFVLGLDLASHQFLADRFSRWIGTGRHCDVCCPLKGDRRDILKGVCHEIFWVLFWHVWIDLGLYKNL